MWIKCNEEAVFIMHVCICGKTPVDWQFLKYNLEEFKVP